MPMNYYQLIYRSWAREEPTDVALKELLIQARAFNESRRISGILLYSEGQYVQIIEGEKDEVEALYRRISGDLRHTDVLTLAAGPIARRMFPDWTMGFATVAAPKFAWLAGYIDTRKANFLLPRAHIFSDEVRDLLVGFVKGHLVS